MFWSGPQRAIYDKSYYMGQLRWVDLRQLVTDECTLFQIRLVSGDCFHMKPIYSKLLSQIWNPRANSVQLILWSQPPLLRRPLFLSKTLKVKSRYLEPLVSDHLSQKASATTKFLIFPWFTTMWRPLDSILLASILNQFARIWRGRECQYGVWQLH